MIRYLTLEEVLELHRLVLEQSGGLDGVRDLGGLDSALAQPRMTFSARICIRTWPRRQRRWGFRWYATTPFWMAINVSAMRRWKPFWSSMAGSWRRELMSKNK